MEKRPAALAPRHEHILSRGTPLAITPYLYYENVERALEWLSDAFGFHERKEETMRGAEGTVVHASMELGSGIIMLGNPGADYQNPKRLGQTTQNLYVYVDDVGLHFERAKQAGATVLSDPEETFYGDRRYGVEDLEGHHWYFAQKLRDIPAENWKPTAEDLKGHG